MKGYELYSWKVGTDWNYTLITGTNRPKTFEEVSAATGVVDDQRGNPSCGLAPRGKATRGPRKM